MPGHELADSAVVDEALLGFGEVVPGDVGGDAFGLGGALHLGVPGRAILRFGPGVDGAVVEGLGAVGDDEVGVEVDGVAEALAARAGAVGVVEAEEARLGLAVGAVAGGALEGGGESQCLRGLGVFARERAEDWISPDSR